MLRTYREYIKELNNFFARHDYDYKVHTSPMNNGNYSKTYAFEDGATWYENVSVETVKLPIEVKKVKIDVEVKMLKTEYYSTDDGESKCYYEKY